MNRLSIRRVVVPIFAKAFRPSATLMIPRLNRRVLRNLSLAAGTSHSSTPKSNDNPTTAESSSSAVNTWDYKPQLQPSLVQKAFLASGSAVLAMLNPWRGDMIAVLGETTGDWALAQLRKQMESTEEGREILRTKPRVTNQMINFPSLQQLPQGTFGRAYADFMGSQGFTPDGRSQVRLVQDAELAYVMQRYREVHDFWHVLTGLPTSVLGELAQKYFELLQTQLPMCAISAFGGPLRLSSRERLELMRVYYPWAYNCNKTCARLITVHWEKYLHEDLAAVREKFGITPAPVPFSSSSSPSDHATTSTAPSHAKTA